MIQSLLRSMELLEVLKEKNRNFSIAELAEAMDLPPSTVHRILQTFCEKKYVIRDDRSHTYRLGPALIPLGKAAARGIRLQDAAHSILTQLAKQTKEDAYLVIPVGNKGLVIEKVDGPSHLKVVEEFGYEMYMHCGAIRKVLLAWQTPAFIDEYFKNIILHDQAFPYGKQVMNRGGMWYTPVSGIWQTVWLESVPGTYIENLNIENHGASVTISTVPPLEGTVSVEQLGQFPLEHGQVTIAPENPHFWCPDAPYLYRFTVETAQDKVESYFAIRSLEIKKVVGYPRLCLNGKPYFFHGLLDQGYWPEGLLTAPAPESYADDILAMKRLGFNTLRKHIKVEPEEFYYQCDRLGMIVWQDMVNNSSYSYFRDTVLPTIGIQKWNDRRLHLDERSRNTFRQGAADAVNQLKNHPCICYWTIFNEGWGQFDSDRVCGWFRTLDATRFIDTTSGWFRGKNTDVDSRHQYFGKLRLKGDGLRPLVLSEFGGKTWRVEGHIFNPDKTYGYGACPTREALNEAVAALYREFIVPAVEKGLCAAIYTQVSDVEDEVNGLITYDRRVVKLDADTMLPISRALQDAMEKTVASFEKMG